MIVHLIEERDMANVITMCKQLGVLAHRTKLTDDESYAVQNLPTQIMEALGIDWAEGPETSWEHLVEPVKLEHQLSYGIYRRRAFREPLSE